MRISAKDTMFGYPAPHVRNLLRRTGGDLSLDIVCDVMKVGESAATILLLALEENGYIEQSGTHDGWWRPTVKGSALAMASAGPPLKRSAADQLLLEFLARAEQVRDEPHWCFKLDRAVLFGSYLSDTSVLGDVDVAITLRPAHADAEAQEAAQDHRRTEAEKAGRHFPNMVVHVYWPQIEVRQFLKARRLSLHDLKNDEPVVAAGTHVTIYSADQVQQAALPMLADWSDDKSRAIRDSAAAGKAFRRTKRRLAKQGRVLKEQEAILAKLERFESMSSEERALHHGELVELLNWVRRRRATPEGNKD